MFGSTLVLHAMEGSGLHARLLLVHSWLHAGPLVHCWLRSGVLEHVGLLVHSGLRAGLLDLRGTRSRL